jgi:hypothetical protein
MEANPYLPPDSVVIDPVTTTEIAPTIAVSITKLLVMDIGTFGLYQFYWFYRHWVAVRRRGDKSIMPFWRAFFGVIWCYSLFSRIHEDARKEHVDNWISVGTLAAGWVILNLCSRLPDPFWLVTFLSVFFLVPIQRQANDLNAKMAPTADRNSRFTWVNIAWLAIMAVFWALVIIALLLPAEA